MKTPSLSFLALILLSALQISAIYSPKLFNRFISNFDESSIPYAIDENFMIDRHDNPEKYKTIDPIFFEFIFEDKDKEKIFDLCGGYDGITADCIVHSYIAKPNLSSNFHSIVYTESYVDTIGERTSYYMNTYAKDGDLVSRCEMARMYNQEASYVAEGYIFGSDNILRIDKTYETPESIQKLSKSKYKVTSKGKIIKDKKKEKK